MNPKIFALAFGAMLFALCSSAEAQQTVRLPTIGWLDHSSSNPEVLRLVELFRKGAAGGRLHRGKKHSHRVPICTGENRAACRTCR